MLIIYWCKYGCVISLWFWFLWHIDGNHKLIRWRFVLHGRIFGYSHKIVSVKCNNILFHGAVQRNVQPIERLWVDVERVVIHCFQAICYYLGDRGILSPLNEIHLHKQHFIFTQKIIRNLQTITNPSLELRGVFRDI